MHESSREEYWDGAYVQYWKAKVAEANQHAQSHGGADAPPPSDAVFEHFLSLLDVQANDRVLEMGCGFGRTIPVLTALTPHVDAIDISQAMISEAKRSFEHLQSVSFRACAAEKTGFEDGRFDRIVCFGVFDALYQLPALLEMNRILAQGGRLLVTGKNHLYHTNDELALVAERNARAKGHPNYFTDVAGLRPSLGDLGFAVLHERYYERRGDMAAVSGTSVMPERFYEFAFILTKNGSPAEGTRNLQISSDVSRTFREIFPEECASSS